MIPMRTGAIGYHPPSPNIDTPCWITTITMMAKTFHQLQSTVKGRTESLIPMRNNHILISLPSKRAGNDLQKRNDDLPLSMATRRIWLPVQSRNYDALLKFVVAARILPLGQTATVLVYPSKCTALGYVNEPFFPCY
jgi:hypothetical protein